MDIKVVASGSSGNSYTVSDGATTLLLDAGIPVKQIQVAVGFQLSKIDGALITHEHKDHSKAVKDLVKLGVDVYASGGTIGACGVSSHRLHTIKAFEELTIGTFRILPFDVEHDAAEPLGFLCTSRETSEKLLYFTDTYFVRYRFHGLTHIMAECNYTEDGLHESLDNERIDVGLAPRIIRSHMSLEHLLEMLDANDMRKVKQIYLLHLSDNNSDADRMKLEVQRHTGSEVYVC